MTSFTRLLFATALFAPGACQAAAALDGTWKMDPSTATFGGKPFVLMLKDGVFDCKNGLVVTYRTEGDKLSMSTPTGQSYTATINGPQAPCAGDPGTYLVSVKKIGNSVYRETYYHAGKAVFVSLTTIADDGRTAEVVTDTPSNGQHMEFVQTRQ